MSIFDATRLLVFFATPHRAGESGTVGDIAAKIFSTALGTVANGLFDTLRLNSDKVTHKFDQVPHLFQSCAVINLIEEKEGHGTDIVCLFENSSEGSLLKLLDGR